MFPCPTSPLARQSGLWQNWLGGFIAGLLSTRSCTHRQITSGRVPEGPAYFQAIRRLATVNWGGTEVYTRAYVCVYISAESATPADRPGYDCPRAVHREAGSIDRGYHHRPNDRSRPEGRSLT